MFETDVAMELKQINSRLGQLMQQNISKCDLRVGLLNIAMLVKKYPHKNQKDLKRVEIYRRYEPCCKDLFRKDTFRV